MWGPIAFVGAVAVGAGLYVLIIRGLAFSGRRRDQGDRLAAEFTLADAENINDYVDPEVVDDQPASRTPDELDSMIKSANSYQQQQQYWRDLADWEAQL